MNEQEKQVAEKCLDKGQSCDMSDTPPQPIVPEKLNLFDRFFNRTRKVFHDRGVDQVNMIMQDKWTGERRSDLDHIRLREWVEYRVIDRLTGSETIEREYLT